MPYIEKRDYANLHAKPQLEVIIGLFADVINTNEQKLWIIAFHFIYLHLIERFSIQWLNMYPQFENIKSKDQAIDIYVHLSLENGQKGKAAKCDRKYYRFAFSCWLFFECIDCSTLCTICLHTDEEIEKSKKDLENARIKEKLLQSRSDIIVQWPTLDSTRDSITIEKVDKYSGAEFEAFIGSLFEADGYQIEFTQASNDKVIDVIAKRNGISIGIQCKRYSSAVGISSVQEAFSGKNFYSLDKALVVTNNTFTKAAKDLADSTDVVLWDRDILNAKIRLLY